MHRGWYSQKQIPRRVAPRDDNGCHSERSEESAFLRRSLTKELARPGESDLRPARGFRVRRSVANEESRGGGHVVRAHECEEHSGGRLPALARLLETVRAEADVGVTHDTTSGLLDHHAQQLARGLRREKSVADVILIRRDTDIDATGVPVDRRQALAHSGQKPPLSRSMRAGLPRNGGLPQGAVRVEDDQPYAREKLGDLRRVGTHVSVTYDWP